MHVAVFHNILRETCDDVGFSTRDFFVSSRESEGGCASLRLEREIKPIVEFRGSGGISEEGLQFEGK